MDVGHGQLDARLRADPRVVVREKVNARSLSAAEVPERVDLAVVDVSFISLRLILPAVAALAKPGAPIVALVKPQFEAGPRRSPARRRRAIRGDPPAAWSRKIEEAGRRLGLEVLGSIRSPIQGARGNEEFLLGFRVN